MKFNEISEYLEKIDKTSSRLEITEILYSLFLKLDSNDLQNFIYFCKGTLGPKYKTKELNIGQSQLLSLVSEYLSMSEEDVKQELFSLGDIGLIVEKNFSKKKQSTLFSKELTFKEIFDTFVKISETQGKGSFEKKQQLFKYVLFNSGSVSAKYLLRFPISFRLGFGDSTIVDALVKLITQDFKISLEEENLKETSKENLKETLDQENNLFDPKEIKEIITEKYLLISDLGLIAKIIKENGIDEIKKLKIKPFIPIKSQLCERVKSLEEIKERLGIMAIDTKIDGFRQQVHKFLDVVKIYSRQDEDITDMFPEIVDAIKKIPYNFIIDCESIAYDEENKKYHSFQVTITRKRKYDILEKSKELPLHLKVFDCLYFDEEEIYSLPFLKRREFVKNYFNHPPIISPTHIKVTESLKELQDFFENSLNQGFEGIIVKDINAPYKAGSRGYSWIKFKKSYKDNKNLDTIDAVIVGAFYGQGKRAELGLGAILVALYDDFNEKYYTIAKIGTGLCDQTILDLFEKLNQTKLKEKPNDLITNIIPDFYVVPKIVVEINYDDITKSPMHTSNFNEATNQGLALRFPRFIKIRTDKDSKETTTPKELDTLFLMQGN